MTAEDKKPPVATVPAIVFGPSQTDFSAVDEALCAAKDLRRIAGAGSVPIRK